VPPVLWTNAPNAWSSWDWRSGAVAEGAVRSNARKALDLGVSPDELHHVAMLAITTAGFPTAIAGLQWIDEVLSARQQR
jgi:alkylhydroperoxidase/carboxymuconolactone decarboxylase family protein YurZ